MRPSFGSAAVGGEEDSRVAEGVDFPKVTVADFSVVAEIAVAVVRAAVGKLNWSDYEAPAFSQSSRTR